MSNQDAPQSLSRDGSERNISKKGRYYVQSLTAHIFLVRERFSIESKPGADDPIVRSFDAHYDADSYASSLNDEKGRTGTHTNISASRDNRIP
jgi:hypothetical protein